MVETHMPHTPPTPHGPHRSHTPTGGDDAQDAPLAPYAIEQSAEVLSWLGRLLASNAVLSLSSPGGSAVSTQLCSLDDLHGRIGFDAAGVSTALSELVASDEVTAVAYLDDVKLQFDLHDLLIVHGARSSALQAALPQRMYRFQRRSAYRVRAQGRTASMAEFRHPSLPDMRIALRVLDISIGGCALLLPVDVPPVPAGVAIGGARLRLDADTRLDVTLQVHHVTSIQPGPPGTRLGCSLVGLSSHASRALQRHIDQIQKRQRMAASSTQTAEVP